MTLIEAEKAQLYYESHGEGPALVFAHGAGGNGAIWYQQVPVFRDRYRVITFDHRGFARSACASEDVNAQYFADDLRRILDNAGIDRTVVVSQSMGGWTAILAAAAYPDRIAGVVLGNTPGPVRTPEVKEAFVNIRKRLSDTSGVANLALAADLPERDPAKAFLYAQISGFNPVVDTGSLLIDMDTEIAKALPMPVRVICTDGDVLFPAPALRSAAAVYGAEVVEITGAGHSPYFEKPAEFNAAVDRFLHDIDWTP